MTSGRAAGIQISHGDIDHRIGCELAAARIITERTALGLERDQRGQVQSVLVDNGAERIAGGDEHRAFLDEEARRVLADRAKALDRDPRALQRYPEMLPRHVDRAGETKAGGADLIERDAADLARQSDRAAGLVFDPSHCRLVGSHIRPRDIFVEIGDRGGEGSDQPRLLAQRHLGVCKDHRFAAAMRQTGGSALEGHCPRQPEGFLGADIGGHAHAADRRSASDIVDRDYRSETDRRPVDLYQLEWS
jgi:hypothetical protein